MLARIVATGALYKKTLELNLKTIGELTIGKIVNLASNDVQRLDIVSQRLLSTQIYARHFMCVRIVFGFLSSPLGFHMFPICIHCASPRCNCDIAVVVLRWPWAQLSARNGATSPADAPAVSCGQAVRKAEVGGCVCGLHKGRSPKQGARPPTHLPALSGSRVPGILTSV